jgi:exodeoxyribonuclease V beta subunit
MADHHYFLQYHLYLVALHRYLAYRLPGYDYDTHFGGVYYLFIRGMSKEKNGFGVFRDRPGREMVEALSDLFWGE